MRINYGLDNKDNYFLIYNFNSHLFARKIPTLTGLIATMPLTAFIVLVLIYFENKGSRKIMVDYTLDAVYNLLPSLLFFIAAFFSFNKGTWLSTALLLSFAVWFLGALVHQLVLR